MSEIKTLSVDVIRLDGETQGRAKLHDDHVSDLRVALDKGDTLPPIVVFFDGKHYWLGDGFHRWHGAVQAKRGSIQCDIRKGTVRDAQLYALTEANRTHGLKLTHEDKRDIIKRMLADKEWGEKSTQWIAKTAGFSRPFVEELRKPTENKKQGAALHPEKRVGTDGKVYSKSPSKKLPSQSDEPETPAEDEPPRTEPGPQRGPASVPQIEAQAKQAARDVAEAEPVSKMFSELLEHLRQCTLLLDRINKLAPNEKLRGEIFTSLDVANTDIIKWRKGAKK